MSDASSEIVCSTVRAFSMRKVPLRLRRSESRWAPLPRASPRSRANARTYVPLLHEILMSARGSPNAELSVTFILLEASEVRRSDEESRTFASLTPPLRFARGPPASVPRVARSSITAYPSENNLQKNGFLVMKIKSAIFVIYNLRKL